MTEPIDVTSRDGLRLEAEVDTPEQPPKAVLVLCHPHPKMGGTMNAPLLLAVRDEMNARGWAVVRFNFRGIGSSEGESSTGEAEVDDALGALDASRRRYADLPHAIAGWSFGGAVALRVLQRDTDLVGGVVIAPAVEPKPGLTAGAPPAHGMPDPIRLHVVVGANDDQVSPDAAREWAAAAGAGFLEMRGANHFFWAKYDQLADAVGEYLDGLL